MAKITTVQRKIDVNIRQDIERVNKIIGDDINDIVDVVNFNDDDKTSKGGYTGTTKDLKDELDNAVFDGAKTYQTESEMLAVTPVPADGTPCKVANDPTISKNGNWAVSGGTWVQSSSVVENIVNSEDIEPDGNSLKLANRDKTINTLGYKYIRSTFNFASIPTGYDNSIWEIRDAFDLSEVGTITLPENAVLRFNGGRLLGGTIVGNNTKIEAGLEQIFDTNTNFSGTFSVDYVLPQWFGAKADGVNDDTQAIKDCLNLKNRINLLKGGVFTITDEIVLPSNSQIIGKGEIFVNHTTNYKRAITLGSNSIVDGVTFRGTGSALPINSSYDGGQRGVAICSYDNAENVSIVNCSFYDFVAPDLYTNSAIIQLSNIIGFNISGCYFDNSNYGFEDINCAYSASGGVYSNNISYSNSDIFINISSVGSGSFIPNTEIPKTANHIISNNIHAKNNFQPIAAGRKMGRHCIIHYTDGISYAIITSNIIGHCSRHGIYLRGSNNSPATISGSSIISNNILWYCGNGKDDTTSYSSGIRCEDILPTIVTNNIINKTGYHPDGTLGINPVSDIECIRGAQNLLISGNSCMESKDYGISIQSAVIDRVIRNVKIIDNIIKTPLRGVYLFGTTGCKIEDIMINSNYIELLNTYPLVNKYGIANEFSVDVEVPLSINYENNTIVGTGLLDKQYGITLEVASNDSYIYVNNNTFRNLEFGIASYRAGATQASYVSHREIGTKIIIKNNDFSNITNALSILLDASQILAVIDKSNRFENCTSNGTGTNLTSNKCLFGSVAGTDASNNVLIEFQATVIPADHQFYRGDKIINPLPSAEGDVGWVCVTSGTPGTWKSIGTIAV